MTISESSISSGPLLQVHENTAIVGAHGKDEVGTDSGAAYVFVRNGAIWTQQAKLTHRDAVPGDLFGFAVSVYGDDAIIGAHQSDAAGPDSGAAYLFRRNGGRWTQDLQLLPNDIGVGDEFGYSVNMTKGAAIIGAPKEDRNLDDMGAAYIFVETRNTWVQQAKLSAADSEGGDEFGSAVAIHEDTAIVGAWKDNHPLPEDPACRSESTGE